MRSSLITTALSALSISLVLAAPSADPYAWSPALADYYSKVSKHIDEARQAPSFPSPPACDLSKASPPAAPTALPSPDGLNLALVAVGRGVQNYTCATSDSTSKPAAVGALASLYNTTCLAATYPDLLSMLPSVFLNVPLPTFANSPVTLPPSQLDLAGHHFFSTNTTPVFELDSSPPGVGVHLGEVVGKKNSNSTAPNGATDVAWLYLTTTNSSVVTKVAANVPGSQGTDWAAVYRVNTAGGQPPSTCDGQTIGQQFSVQYSAVYWFYKGS